MPKKAAKKKTVKIVKKSKTSANKLTSLIVSEQVSEMVRTDGHLLDIEALRMVDDSQSIETHLKWKHAIEACKFDSQEFIRVKDDPEWPITVSLIEYKPRQEFWIVTPEVAKNAGKNSEIAEYRLHLAITEFDRLFVLPVKKGRGSWNESRRIAVQEAVHRWVRVKGDFEKKQYIIIEAADDLGKPQWPDLTLQEIVSIAFEDRVIRDFNHPLLQKMLGKNDR